MGLFSGIGKLVGKVGKFALSQATHGVSDKVIGILKSRGQRPRDLEKMSPAKRDALIAKVMTPTKPWVDSGRRLPPRLGGYKESPWGNSAIKTPVIPNRTAATLKVARDVVAGDGLVGEYNGNGKKRKKSKRDMSNQELDDLMLIEEGKAHIGRPFKSLAERDKYMFQENLPLYAKKRKAKKARTARAPRRARGGRRPPSGGLDLKALSASWKKAGKPGTWQSWIRANK